MAVDVAIELTVTELLTEAREFIADPARWCKGSLALDPVGKPVHDDGWRYASRCCALGAAQLVAWRRGLDTHTSALFQASDLLDLTAVQLYPKSGGHHGMAPTAWVNDHLGHAAILRVYDAAIAASQEAMP